MSASRLDSSIPGYSASASCLILTGLSISRCSFSFPNPSALPRFPGYLLPPQGRHLVSVFFTSRECFRKSSSSSRMTKDTEGAAGWEQRAQDDCICNAQRIGSLPIVQQGSMRVMFALVRFATRIGA